jgi:DNA-binding MarR family transcriptional regulator
MPDTPSPSIPLLMNCVLSSLDDPADEAFATLGLTVRGARILISLRQRPRLRCRILARLVGLDPTALSHQLRSLSGRGLIIRDRVKDDFRAVEVRLTKEGERVAKLCDAEMRAYERRLLKGVAPDDAAALRAILGRMQVRIIDGIERGRTRGRAASGTGTAAQPAR